MAASPAPVTPFGTSPHLRGNPLSAQSALLKSRDIPAPAGEPQHRRHGWLPVEGHPRTCGPGGALLVFLWTAMGSEAGAPIAPVVEGIKVNTPGPVAAWTAELRRPWRFVSWNLASDYLVRRRHRGSRPRCLLRFRAYAAAPARLVDRSTSGIPDASASSLDVFCSSGMNLMDEVGDIFAGLPQVAQVFVIFLALLAKFFPLDDNALQGILQDFLQCSFRSRVGV